MNYKKIREKVGYINYCLYCLAEFQSKEPKMYCSDTCKKLDQKERDSFDKSQYTNQQQPNSR